MITLGIAGIYNSNWLDRFKPLIRQDKIAVIDPSKIITADNLDNKWDEIINSVHKANYVLYCITPLMNNFYTFADLMYKCTKKDNLIFILLQEDYDKITFERKIWEIDMKSSWEIIKMLLKNENVLVYDSLEDCAKYLNQIATEGDI